MRSGRFRRKIANNLVSRPPGQIYVHRTLVRTGIHMTSANWKRTVLGGLIMASKVR
jgi:hypothetical protein